VIVVTILGGIFSTSDEMGNKKKKQLSESTEENGQNVRIRH
jgi:hypothetical protein